MYSAKQDEGTEMAVIVYSYAEMAWWLRYTARRGAGVREVGGVKSKK